MPKDDLIYVGHMSDRVAQVLGKVRGRSRRRQPGRSR
jgi:hypothetical protein